MKHRVFLIATALCAAVICLHAAGNGTPSDQDPKASASAADANRELTPAEREELAARAFLEMMKMSEDRMESMEILIEGKITDDKGNPLSDVSANVEYERPKAFILTDASNSESKRLDTTVGPEFSFKEKGYLGVEIYFSKDGYAPRTLRYSANVFPFEEKDDGDSDNLIRQFLHVVMKKLPPPAVLRGCSESRMTYIPADNARTVCDLSKITRNDAIRMKSIPLRAKPDAKRWLEFDLKRDEKGEIVPGEVTLGPADSGIRAPAEFILRLHSDDPEDGFLMTDQITVRKDMDYNFRWECSEAPEGAYPVQELVFPYKKESVNGRDNKVICAYVKIGGHYGKLVMYYPAVDTRRNQQREIEVERYRIELKLELNVEPGAKSLVSYTIRSPEEVARRKEALEKQAAQLFAEPEGLLRIPLNDKVTLALAKVEAGRLSPDILTEDYYLGQYEVTQEQWKAVMGTDPSRFKGDKLPVEQVGWHDAMKFCAKLNESGKAPEGYRFSLPTEIQWEYAARGGKKRLGSDAKYSGARFGLGDVAWYYENSGDKPLRERALRDRQEEQKKNNCTTHPAGQKAPNELGICDMTGNVFEWCLDDATGDVQDLKAEFTRDDDNSDAPRSYRGGCWNSVSDDCQIKNRNAASPSDKKDTIGFRVALVPEKYAIESARFKLGPNAFLDMVRVEPGKFPMGEGDQKHEVTISAPYWIGQYEVTRAQWQEIMGTERDYLRDGRPVSNVSWDDVQDYCRLLNETVKAPDGYEFTLPTEAQWEYAARGGARSKGYKYSGSDKPEDVAWCSKTEHYGVQYAGQKAPNELWLYDMSGNVMEWCADAYQADISQNTDGDTPVETGDKRVARGGCHNGDAALCAVSARQGESPAKQYASIGFRLVAVPVRKKPAPTKQPATDVPAENIPATVTVELADGVPLTMKKVSAAGARFRMGEGYNSKAVAHFVSFKKDYYIGQYEVTQAQWNALMEANPSGFKGDDLPVEKVLWDEVMEFCKKLNESGKAPAGWIFTLPTEAQWEFAAKGGKDSKGYKFSGGDDLEDVAWYNDNSGDVSLKGMKRGRDYDILRGKNNLRPHPVGTKKPNELGLYDMNGNVKEMCLDSMDFNNTGYSDGDVAVPESRKTMKNTCVIRDIGFLGGAEMGFNTDRTYTYTGGSSGNRSAIHGFRLALVRAPEKTDDDSDDDDSDDGDPNVMKVELPGGVPLKLVKVEAAGAEFSMKTRFETSDYESEHPMRFRNDYYIGKYEITQEQWKAVMGTNPAYNQGDRYPVEKVPWDDVLEFCAKLNAAGKAPDGWKFTLPTEAQWQYAARGGAKSKGYKYSGSDDPDEVAWYYDKSDNPKRSARNWEMEDLERYKLNTHPVGRKKPNELGLYDMSGNVYELVLDSYHNNISDHIDGDAPETGEMNVIRLGGCFATGSLLITPSHRSGAGPYNGYFMDGFRIALVKKPVFASSPADSPIGTAPGANPSGQADESGSLTVTVDGYLSFEFVKVPAAGRTITMKLRPQSEREKKSHTFYFHSDYYIGKYEVTQAQWKAFSRNSSKDKGDDLPVDNVSWDDATAFCKLLNETGKAPEGWEFALPTEAQWEYAARGGAKSKGYVFSGGNDPDEVGWFLDNSGGKTHPVGQKKPNELGIYDMTGNVWEWCADMYEGNYIKNTNGDMAPPKRENAQLVYRGGGRGYEPWFCVVSNRCAFPSYYKLDRFGLRLALVRKRAELQKLAAEAPDQVNGDDDEDDYDSDEEEEEEEEEE